jgi:hypothetical protein
LKANKPRGPTSIIVIEANVRPVMPPSENNTKSITETAPGNEPLFALAQLKMVLQQSSHCSLETPIGKGGEPKTISSKVGSIGSPGVN